MRTIIFSMVFLLISIICIGQTAKKLKGKPKTLEETYLYLDNMFDDTTKYSYMTLPEDVMSGQFDSFGLGMWIRNNWGLWGNSDLKKYFIEHGITHPDHMSGIILSAYYNYLHHKQYEIHFQPDTLINKMSNEERMKYLESKMTSENELIKYYPINDTIVVNLVVTKKKSSNKNNNYSTVRAIAVVENHKEDTLVLKIIKLPLKKNQISKYQVRQIKESSPYDCELIPPKNWKWN